MTTKCPNCKMRPRRAPGRNCLTCEATRKRERRLKSKAKHFDLTVTPEFKRELRETKRYIVTAAQNNTDVDEKFLESLKVAARHLRAELIVVPYRYKNPTGMQPGRDLRNACGESVGGGQCLKPKGHLGSHSPNELWWDPVLKPFLLNQRTQLNANLVLAADVKIQPTATRPLSGFDSLTGAESCIIASPKLQFRTVPVPSGRYPKILTTTGACTEPNYSNTKAGALGEFHYTLGALLVEVEGKTFHLRQLLGTRDGSFIDLNKHYSPTGVQAAPRAKALVLGDTHVRVNDPEVDRATFGKGGIVDVLDPETLVFHDLLDGETVNPHEQGDVFLAAAKQKAGRTDVRAELQEVVEFVNARAHGRKVVVVHSNHHDFLRRWVVRCLHTGCHDAKNLGVFLDSAKHMYETAQMAPGGAGYGDPFPYWMRRLGARTDVRCLEPDESFKVGPIECGMHGHFGPKGSRGSVSNLARLGVKSFVGHGHGPQIEEGCWMVGTSSFRHLAYQRGPDNSLNTHGAVYANDKRCLITVIGPAWRLGA